jgi:hypothetical protein
MVYEKGWDHRMIDAFERDENLAIVGFVGSNEIDMAGGRGLGTTTSFMGRPCRTGNTSAAEVHGARTRGIQPAGVLDHCAMIFRLSALRKFPPQETFHTPGHFYDRIICCIAISQGYHLATMGIECDHFGGGIGLCKVPGKQKGILNRDQHYQKWLTEHGVPYDPKHIDLAMYKESEHRYLSKWRDETHFIPFRVLRDYRVVHSHPRWGK